MSEFLKESNMDARHQSGTSILARLSTVLDGLDPTELNL